MTGYIYKQNFRYRAANNLQAQKMPLYSENVIIWCGVKIIYAISLYCFETAYGWPNTVTENAIHKWCMILSFLSYKTISVNWNKFGTNSMNPQHRHA